MIENDFITIKTFTYPHEAAVLFSKLESEGIECFLKDELTTQINPFYSNAIGGVKLQVRVNDFERASQILTDGGYPPDEKIEVSKSYLKLDSITSKIPFIKNMRLELRLSIIIPTILIIIVSILYYRSLPSTKEELLGNTWCVDYIKYMGKTYQPNSYGIKFIGSDGCSETMSISESGKIFVPGFESFPARGYWSIDENILHVYQLDTLKYIYEGNYSVEITNQNLILKSPTTTIYCFATRFL